MPARSTKAPSSKRTRDRSGGRRAAPDGGDQRRLRRLWRWRKVLFAFALLALVAVSLFGWWVARIPLPDEDPLRQTTFVCAADVQEGCNRSNSLAQLSGDEDRVSVGYEQLPQLLIDAVLAAEDQDFFEHSGLDPLAIGRALWADLRSQDIEQGGSTITQQYVKNVFLTNERTLTRKVKEAALAVKLERELGKEEILERYLNTIYFGRGAYGVQAASRAYFGKDVGELDIADAAYLAGLIRSPESADAWREADRESAASVEQEEEAHRRRETVLDAMLATDVITQDEYDEAVDRPFDDPYLRPRTESSNFGAVKGSNIGTEYFVEYVRVKLREYGFTDAQIYGGGLRVYTTLDYGMQDAAFRAVTETLDEDGDPAAALVAVDDGGRVRAMVGGTSWAESNVNLAVGTEGGGTGRQPGSAFKPVVLATGGEQGISFESVFNSPAEITIPGANEGGPWEVSNFGDAGHGPLTLLEATQKSSNTVYAQLMDEVGPAAVADLARRLGITADLPVVHALALGAGEVSVLDMASAFSTFAAEGEHTEPTVITRVEDHAGNVLLDVEPRRERVLDPAVAQSVNWALRQVVELGTGRAAAFGQPSAGKTGTTQDFRDAWFVGYTCKLTAAVWMGYVDAEPDGTPRLMDDVRGEEVTGGSYPARIWRAFMVEATEDLDSCAFTPPAVFPGEILNPELAVTTTTEDATTTSVESTTSTAEATTTSEAPPPTTAPPPPPTTEPPPPTTASPPTTVGEGG